MYFLAEAPYCIVEGCSFPGLVSIPRIFGDVISTVYFGIRVGVPIILLLAGMIDLVRAITSQKEDDIRKAQGLLFQKIIVAIIIFSFFTLVQFFINIVDQNSGTNTGMWRCVNALLGNTKNQTECPTK
jgi:hypothetical protein